MGMALEIRDNDYKYWFSSDVKSENDPNYPLTGKWEIKKGVLHLHSPPKVHLYADDWVLCESKGRVGLLNPENIKVLVWQKSEPSTRMLFKYLEENGEWPILNEPEASFQK